MKRKRKIYPWKSIYDLKSDIGQQLMNQIIWRNSGAKVYQVVYANSELMHSEMVKEAVYDLIGY